MNAKKLWVLVAALALAVLLLGLNGQARPEPAPPVVWEYKVLYHATEQELNELGKSGWELTGVAAYSDNGNAYYRIYLTRAK